MNFHVRILTIAITTLLLLTGVFVWMTVLDKGTVEVVVSEVTPKIGTADGGMDSTPYMLSYQGAAVKGGRKIECSRNPCSAKLPSGSYGLTVTRDGYFEEVTSVEVARGKTSNVEVALRLIPSVAEVSENYETLRAVFEPDRGLDRFRFGMDTKYKK